MEKPHGFGVNIGSQLDIKLNLFPYDCKLNMKPKLLCLLIRKTEYGKAICWTDTSLILKQTLFEKFPYIDSSKLMF